MGKKLVIKGADFREVAVGKHKVIHTCEELLTNSGNYGFKKSEAYQNLSYTESVNWRSAILPIKGAMYIENATAVNKENAEEKALISLVPSIVFLSSDSTSGYISGSEIYPSRPAGSTEVFATFTGRLYPPANATHVIINTNITVGGSLSAKITWMEDDE